MCLETSSDRRPLPGRFNYSGSAVLCVSVSHLRQQPAEGTVGKGVSARGSVVKRFVFRSPMFVPAACWDWRKRDFKLAVGVRGHCVVLTAPQWTIRSSCLQNWVYIQVDVLKCFKFCLSGRGFCVHVGATDSSVAHSDVEYLKVPFLVSFASSCTVSPENISVEITAPPSIFSYTINRFELFLSVCCSALI